jgi:hypothetical protein
MRSPYNALVIEVQDEVEPPYPWCSRDREECARLGWCKKVPNCGE